MYAKLPVRNTWSERRNQGKQTRCTPLCLVSFLPRSVFSLSRSHFFYPSQNESGQGCHHWRRSPPTSLVLWQQCFSLISIHSSYFRAFRRKLQIGSVAKFCFYEGWWSAALLSPTVTTCRVNFKPVFAMTPQKCKHYIHFTPFKPPV